jgi:peptidoglycan-binding protein ArfA
MHDKNDVMSGYYVTVHTTFLKGSSSLSPVGEAQLKQGYAWLVQYPASKVSVYGYTDSQGSAGLNDSLSARRAREVVLYLKALGLAPERIIKVKGWGSSHPIAVNSTAEGRLINRRVELRITGKSFD